MRHAAAVLLFCSTSLLTLGFTLIVIALYGLRAATPTDSPAVDKEAPFPHCKVSWGVLRDASHIYSRLEDAVGANATTSYSFAASNIWQCMRMCMVLADSCTAITHFDETSTCHLASRSTSRPLLDTVSKFSVSVLRWAPFPHACVDGASPTQCLLLCKAIDGCAGCTFQPSGDFGRCWLLMSEASVARVLNARLDPMYACWKLYDIMWRVREFQKVVYGLLAGPQFIATRLKVAAQTWLRNEHFVVYIEDGHVARAADAMAAVRNTARASFRFDVVGLSAPSDDRVRSVNGAWKNLAIMQHLASHYPDAPWYVIADDDSFIITHNLHAMLRQYTYATIPYYLGAVFSSGMSPPNDVLFIQGGAGIVLNRAAAKAILPLLNESRPSNCFAACQQWAGDIRLGCCFAQLNIAPVGEQGFSSQTIFESLVRDNRPGVSTFPISFHNMRRVEWVTDLQSVIDAASPPGSDEVVSWDTLLHQYRVVWSTRFPEAWFVEKTPVW